MRLSGLRFKRLGPVDLCLIIQLRNKIALIKVTLPRETMRFSHLNKLFAIFRSAILGSARRAMAVYSAISIGMSLI